MGLPESPSLHRQAPQRYPSQRIEVSWRIRLKIEALRRFNED